MPYRPDFSVAELQKFSHDIERDFHDCWADHYEWMEKRAQAFEDLFDPNKILHGGPWEFSSNIDPPLVAKLVRGVWPRIVNGIVGMSPLAQAVAVNPAEQEDADARAAWMNHRILNLIPGFKRTFSTFCIDLINSGDSVLKPWHEFKMSYEPHWIVLDNFNVVMDANGEPIDIIRKTDDEVLAEVFDGIESKKRLGNHEYKIVTIEKGRHHTAYAHIDWEDKMCREDQVSITIEGEHVISRVRLKTLNPGNLVAPSYACGYGVDEAETCNEMMWMTPDQIEADPNFFNLTKGDHKYLRKITGDHPQEDIQAYEQVQAELTGIDSVWGITGIRNRKIRVIKHYRPVKTRGRTKQMIFWSIPVLKSKIARWEFLKAIFGHGDRPYVDGSFIPLSNRVHGVGMWHLAYPYQDEASTILNQMNDRENLVNRPRLLNEKNSGITEARLRGSPPGDILTVKNVERIRPLVWDINPHGGMPVLQQMYAFAEQIAGIGDLQVGVQPNRPNAPRTARGTLALISEGNIILDTHISLVQESFSRLLNQIDGLDQQYIDPETRFMTTGKEERVIMKQQFEAPVRFYLTGNTANTNPQVQQAVSQLMYQNLLGNPLITGEYTMMPPAAIEGMYRVTEEFVAKHSPGNDASRYLKPLEFYLQTAQEFQQAQQQGAQQGQQAQAAAQEREADREDVKVMASAYSDLADAQSKARGQNMELFREFLKMMGAQRESEGNTEGA